MMDLMAFTANLWAAREACSSNLESENYFMVCFKSGEKQKKKAYIEMV
jgi:hypothetical protein